MRTSRNLFRLTALCAALAASACAVGPDFKSPDAPATQAYGPRGTATTVSTPVPGGEAQTFVSGKPVPAQWWTQFGSEKLNALVDQAFANSPSLAAAQAALRQSAENYRALHANLYPSIDGQFSATRQKIDSGSFGNPGGGSAIYNLFNASVGVTYALDFFGAARRTIEAQGALNEAQQFQYEGTYQTLAANVVTAAVQEARLRALISGKRKVIGDLERQYGINTKQFELGAVGKSEVLTAQASLAGERAVLPALELELSRTQNQLAVLLGKTPGEHVATDFDLSELKLPQDVPLSLPSELVRQRPDVRAAEAMLHQASANIGVATAAQLPQILINGSYGTQASQIENLFETTIWSVGANITQPLFRAGQLRARKRAAVAAYAEAQANYKLAVLQGFQNVADTLRALETGAQVLEAQYQSAEAAQKALELAEKQYSLGVISYLDVLTMQRQATLAKTGLVQALADRYQNTAALFLALGGGWWNRDEQTQPGRVPE